MNFSRNIGHFFKLIRLRNQLTNITLVLGFLAVKLPNFSLGDAVTILLTFIILGPLTYGAIYIFNDICDLQFDRKHPRKRLGRAIAAGEVSVKSAGLTASVLVVVALISGYFFSKTLFLIQLIFIALSLFYSLYAKKIKYLDIAINALSHPLRTATGVLMAGGSLSMYGPLITTHIIESAYGPALRRADELKYAGVEVRPTLAKYSPKTLTNIQRLCVITAIVHLAFTWNAPGLWFRVIIIVFPISISYLLNRSHAVKKTLDTWYYGNK